MGSHTRFSCCFCQRTLILLLFVSSVTFQLFALFLSYRSERPLKVPSVGKAPVSSILWEIPSHIQLQRQSVGPTVDFNISKWNFTGSEDLDYRLNIDMPELVRRISSGLPVDIQPINEPVFDVLISHAEICTNIERKNQQPPELLILIKSAPGNFLLRDTIRVGWGDESCWGGRHIVRLFLLGAIPDSQTNVSSRIAMEVSFHGDVIQQNFIDDYYNNTYKIMFGIDWAVNNCANVPVIMFVDDDFFVYPRNVIAFIEGLSIAIREHLAAGYVWRDAKPVRTKRYRHLKKWAIDWNDYPGAQYPPYVAAGNFFISMQVARKMHIASRFTKYLRFDDVFLGIVLKKLLLTPMHLPQIYAFSPVNESTNQLELMLSSHNFGNPARQLALWDRLQCRTFCTPNR
ncbi:unnamed protein product [Dicrocoelium dendriticum]|nr:unnamed protein product [Dicrocoelium dendriticum]